MLTTGRPANMPAKATTPSPAASTGDPGGPARSTPRCPAAYGFGRRLERPGHHELATDRRRPERGGRRRGNHRFGGRRHRREHRREHEGGAEEGEPHRTSIQIRRPAGGVGRGSVDGPVAWGNRRPHWRMLFGATRPDGSTSRVLLPPHQAGQSPPPSP